MVAQANPPPCSSGPPKEPQHAGSRFSDLELWLSTIKSSQRGVIRTLQEAQDLILTLPKLLGKSVPLILELLNDLGLVLRVNTQLVNCFTTTRVLALLLRAASRALHDSARELLEL